MLGGTFVQWSGAAHDRLHWSCVARTDRGVYVGDPWHTASDESLVSLKF